MLSNDKGNELVKKPKIPTAVVKHIENASVAIRFEAIGDRNRFRVLLQHFRFAFVLARCEELDNITW